MFLFCDYPFHVFLFFQKFLTFLFLFIITIAVIRLIMSVKDRAVNKTKRVPAFTGGGAWIPAAARRMKVGERLTDKTLDKEERW